MGFRPEPTVYKLTFEGTPLDGLHVRVGCCTVGEHNKMTGLVGAASSTQDIDISELAARLEEVSQHNEWVLNLFVKYLVSWDLEDLTGQPVPCTREGIDSQERSLISMVMAAWQRAMVTIPNLSSEPSTNGETSEEQSLGLGSSSESQKNS